jgi:ArsR family transcriptional regulator
MMNEEGKRAGKGTGGSFDREMFFKALADRTWLRLINLMGNDEVCVCFFVAVLGASQPKISRHLGYLRRAGVVTARRDGKWMHYRIVEPPDGHATVLLNNIRTWLQSDREMQRDRIRLAGICCAPMPPVQLRGAPRPASLAAESK